ESQFGWHIIKKIESKGEGDNLEVHGAHILFTKQQAQEGVDQATIDELNNQNKSQAEEILQRALKGENFSDLANEYSQDPGNQPQPEFVSTGLTGKNLKSATVTFQNQGLSEPQVSLKFDDEGTKLFADITKRNLEKRVAIYLDGQVISAPTVQSEITTGEAVITGRFTVDQAKELVRRLNEGALPVPITLVGQQSVEASLGQISLEKSLKAGMIGLLLVIAFMLLYYRFLGLIASVALLIYTALMISIFKVSTLTAWSMTLTLPGIAGFVLSIGMAVDANILIFERTKEEIRRGRKITAAIDEGFKRAWTSIRDGNVSSIITALILMEMGTGFVKGFAVTLLIGVLVSMFTAVMITRTILNFIMGEWIEDKMYLIGVKKKNV
ncbi:MAG TPA: protein translocase subunit SecD, partial [Patescibacteria group bacterium]|nr:protein translocase subunit SecD [Patescibacteria group bacterium]